MVDKALGWLEKQQDDRLGGKCLMGLAFFKAGRDPKHPKIVEALAACEANINGISHERVDNYSVGLALIFLLETDPAKNRALAERYVQEILKRQQSGGGWGYFSENKGDTSQTQYPTLGLWLARQNGLSVLPTTLEKTCGWLVRTQDPSGAWQYKGDDPGNYQRIQQPEIRVSLVAAGLGSLYICADALGIGSIDQPAAEGQPAALKPVQGEGARPNPPGKINIDAKLIRRAMADGNKWFEQNFTVEPPQYRHYYLYAFERYQSYKELMERKVDPKPRWYDQVVAMLKQTQMAEGHWQGEDTEWIATSFAVLALVRSARQTIRHIVGDLGSGVLLGGMGLPANTADLKEQDGKVVQTPLAGSLDELLALLDDPKNADLDRLAESPAALTLESDVTRRAGQIARLRAIVTAGPYEARLAAVRALAKMRELDNVPLLAYALTDPDLRIVREADKGLRFISRKIEGFGMPAEPKPAEIKVLASAWKDWYRSIRPNAEFLD